MAATSALTFYDLLIEAFKPSYGACVITPEFEADARSSVPEKTALRSKKISMRR